MSESDEEVEMRWAAALLVAVVVAPTAACFWPGAFNFDREVGPKVSGPVKISGQAPRCTEEARAGGVHGVAVVKGRITALGEVTEIELVEGLPMGMDLAVTEAVRAWRFEPATRDGEPVSVIYSTTLAIDCSSEP